MRPASWFCLVGFAVSACSSSSPSSPVDLGAADEATTLSSDLAQPGAADLASQAATDLSSPLGADAAHPTGDLSTGDGPAVASCLVPADCPAGAPICCLTASPMTMTGSSACTTTCVGSISNTNVVTTKACTTDTDCVGYMGTAFGFTTPWTSCCSKTTTPAHFCLDPNFKAQGGYTCP